MLSGADVVELDVAIGKTVSNKTAGCADNTSYVTEAVSILSCARPSDCGASTKYPIDGSTVIGYITEK